MVRAKHTARKMEQQSTTAVRPHAISMASPKHYMTWDTYAQPQHSQGDALAGGAPASPVAKPSSQDDFPSGQVTPDRLEEYSDDDLGSGLGEMDLFGCLLSEITGLPKEASNESIDSIVANHLQPGLLAPVRTEVKQEVTDEYDETDSSEWRTPPGLPSEVEQRAKVLQGGIQADGKFDLRAAAGGLWARALKACSKLRRDYAAVGSSYQMQRAFRKSWCEKEFKAIVSQDSTRESSMQGEKQRVRHLSLSQIMWEEKTGVLH